MIGKKQGTPAPRFTKLTERQSHLAPQDKAFAEQLCGRGDKTEHYGMSGCRINVEAVLVRGSNVSPYTLAVRLGDEWRSFGQVAPDDPAIAELPIVEVGPSPAQVRKEREQEEARRQRIEAEEAERARRQAIHAERKRLAEEHQRRALQHQYAGR